MEKQKLKGLVIQNNPFSYNTGNGKTVASMLSKWDKESLAQIYVSELQPDFSICRHFFKMSDRAALNSFINRKPFGVEVTDSEQHEVDYRVSDPANKGNDFIKKIKSWMSESSFVTVMRDFVWQKSKWNNQGLTNWLDRFKPDFVYLVAGNMAVFYDMALFICERYNIPLYVHIGDDYFIYRSGLSPWKNLHRKKMSRRLSEVIIKSQCVFAICDKMARVFQEKYGGRYYVSMNCIDLHQKKIIHEKKQRQDITLVYAGNLGINRWKVLSLIGQALMELREEGIHAHLDVYSSYVPDKHICKKLTLPPVMQFCGSAYGEELNQIKENADILVHVEAFEKRYRQLTYTAMSTKISEYLGIGQNILAVGPEEAASIEFLDQNNIAMVVTTKSKEEIKKQIRCYAKNPDELENMRYRATQIAKDKFSISKNAQDIWEIIAGRQ